MTWSNITTTGDGSIAFRLVIAGHPVEFVTSTRLVSAAVAAGTNAAEPKHYRSRVAGLKLSSISWGESLNVADCKLTANGFTAEIVEDMEHTVGDSFALVPTYVNYLDFGMTYNTTTVICMDPNIPNGSVIYIDSECMLVTANGMSTSMTVTRGFRQTDSFAHPISDVTGLTSITRPEITYVKPSVEGQMVYLYAYGDGETISADPATAATENLVWTGVVATSPQLRNGHTWEFGIDSITSLLKQQLSSDLSTPATFRGITYSDDTAPSLFLKMWDAATPGGSTFLNVTNVILSDAFYETQEEFFTVLNTAISSSTASWTYPLNAGSDVKPTLMGIANDDGTWGLAYNTPSVNYKFLTVVINGPLEPKIISDQWNNSIGEAVSTVAASSMYTSILSPDSLPGAGSVPRGLLGQYTRGVTTNRLAISSERTLAVDDTVIINWPAYNGSIAENLSYKVLTWDPTALTASAVLVGRRTGDSLDRRYNADFLPEMTFSRTYSAEGSVITFLEDLISDTAVYAPAGRQPFVTNLMVNTAGSHTACDNTLNEYPWRNLRYYGGASSINLEDLITEECKVGGVIPSIDTDGRLVLKPFRFKAATATPDFTISAENNLSSKNFPGFEISPYGMINTVKFYQNFDPLTGDSSTAPITIRDSDSLSRNKLSKIMEIKPQSNYITPDGIVDGLNAGAVMEMAKTWIGALGIPYYTVTITCPLTALNTSYPAIIGNNIELTVSQLPNISSGGRGITGAIGIIIGRKVSPLQGTVELTVMVTTLRLAGYAPSSDIDVITSAGGSSYDIYLSYPQTYTGFADISFWEIGDKIRITEWNIASPDDKTATITDIIEGANQIVCSSSYALHTAITTPAMVEYDTASSVQESQQQYCFIADSTIRIPYTTPGNARQFSS